MNKFTRLTALLLAMLMIFSTFASAETAYQVGSMTVDDWQSIVDSAEEKLFTVEQGGEIIEQPTSPEVNSKPYQNTYEVKLSESTAEMTTADLTIVTSDVAGQWQIAIGETVNENNETVYQWANLGGETGATLNVNYAMLANASHPVVRQVVYDADNNLVETGRMTFTVTEPVAVMSLNMVARAGEGEVSTPTAADNVMTLEDANTKISLVINYMRNGVSFATSYNANFVQGATYTATVTHPAVQGYTPTYQFSASQLPAGVTVTAVTNSNNEETAVTYSFTNLEAGLETLADITIHVEYQPVIVPYTVEHWVQKADAVNNNDYANGYDLHSTVPMSGLTESPAEATALVLGDAFYSLRYETPDIAADGGTVVKIYYNRQYYLMNFDLDGGYGVEPVYARYEATIPDVGVPTKAGYTFKGWATTKELAAAGQVDVDALPPKMPDQRTTYYAVWEMDATAKVTIVFWGENADDEEYSYIKSAEVYTKPNTSFTYNEDGSLICGQDVHTHNTSCGYACGATEHIHVQSCYMLICQQEVHSHSNTCYTCNTESHTHSTACYAGVGNSVNGNGRPRNPSEGLVDEGWSMFGDNPKYIYIKGTWYNYTGSTSDGQIAPTTCGKTESTHTHTDACIGCGKTPHVHTNYTGTCYTLTCTTTEHSHSDSCGYNCGKTAHSHSSSCYMSDAGLDSKLWTFVESDTVTVAPDGSTVVNVYYDRTTFTLTFRTGNNSSSKVYEINEKWGHDISDHWPIKGTNGTTYNNGERWDPSGSSTYSEVLVYLAIMPAESFTLTLNTSNKDTYIMHYMVEVVPGQTGTAYNGKSFKESFTVEANYGMVTEDEDFFDLNGYEQWTSNPQFSNGEINTGGGDVYFYYTRNNYKLTFNDGYNDVRTEDVLYEAPLSTYGAYVPDVPEQMEEGSVYFDGWYLNPECSGDEYVLAENTMPSANLILYAKWEPIVHTVRFFLTEALMETGLDENIYTPQMVEDDMPMPFDPARFQVPHGKVIDDVYPGYVNNYLSSTVLESNSPREGYRFMGWFYYDETGTKRVFEPSTAVMRDMDLFAEWTSDILIDYRVRYVYVKSETEYIQIADDEIGSRLAGNTETFYAKTGAQLYEGYQNGYYPSVTQSHSVVMEPDENGNIVEIVYTFYYYSRSSVPYIVRYLEEGTGNVLKEQEVVANNGSSVVSENYVPMTGYMPDSFSKRLVLNGAETLAEGQEWIVVNGIQVHPENVITFYYSKNTEQAFVVWSHYLMDINGVYDTAYATEEEICDVDKEYTSEQLAVIPDGFAYEKTVVVNAAGDVLGETTDPTITQILTVAGLHFKHYYKRLAYDYTVHYYLQGTETSVYDSKTVSGTLYEKLVSEAYVDLSPAYRLVSLETQSLKIGTDPTKNVIIFEYDENPVTIAYVVAGGVGGTVSSPGETLPAMTGTAVGSVATALPGYTFDGWYVDVACTQKVSTPDDGTLSADGMGFVPAREPATTNLPNGYYEDATFYAKFTENTVAIQYVAVGPDGAQNFGSVTPTEETVGEATGTPSSTATANAPTYKFVGWYSDAVCENRLTTDVTLVPPKVDGLNVAATYYAKFDWHVGSLTITKTVIYPEGYSFPDDKFTFTVTLEDDTVNGEHGDVTFTNGVATFELTNGAEVTIDNLVHGTTYTVEETGMPIGYTLTAKTGDSGSIEAGQTKTAAFTNTFAVGSLTVTKTVEGADAPKDKDGNFTDEFTFTLKVEGFAGLKVEVNGVENTLDANGATTFTMKHGETVIINGIPDDANYTVTETPDSDYKTTANGAESYAVSDTMDADVAATANFVNTYKYSHLTIEKKGMEDGESAIFEVKAQSKYNNDQELTFAITVPNGGSVTIGELLIGSGYTITEVSSWSNRYAAVSVAPGTIVEGGTTVTVTNGDKNQQWLHGEDYVHNDFSNPGTYGN